MRFSGGGGTGLPLNQLEERRSSILFGDVMIPGTEYDYVLLLGIVVSYKEYSFTRSNHQKKPLAW